MSGNALTVAEAFHPLFGVANIHLYFSISIGDRVVVTIHLNVVVDIDSRFAPLCKDVGVGRQRV